MAKARWTFVSARAHVFRAPHWQFDDLFDEPWDFKNNLAALLFIFSPPPTIT